MERSKASGAKSRPLLSRLAGAPIAWGVCEAPGWGYQLAAERVLTEIFRVGFCATEPGPGGFLPGNPAELRALLGRHDLSLVGGFVPVTLHNRSRLKAVREVIQDAARALHAAGSDTLIVGIVPGVGPSEERAVLDAAGWRTLASAVKDVEKLCADQGLTLAVHPRHGTMIQSEEEVNRLLDHTGASLCLDIGHLVVGGADALRLTKRATGRVHHVHLKDVDATLAARVRHGKVGYRDAVRDGLYVPLGQGDAQVKAIIEHLESTGYSGWYVFEQDAVLEVEPASGKGPLESARKSYQFLESLAA